MASVISITRHNFETEIKNATKPVVIDVFATWCGPCQHMAPFFEELSEEFSEKYLFAKLNIDEARDLAIEFGVQSVPTFLFFKKGELVGQQIGYMSKEDLKDALKKHLDE